MKSKKQVAIERRVFSHLKVPLLIHFSFVSQWDDTKASKMIKARVWDVSTTGLCLETEINMKDGVLEFSKTKAGGKVRVLPYLVSSGREIKVKLKLPPNSTSILIKGKLIWYELAREGPTVKLRMGVLFTDITREAQDQWVKYVEYAVSV
jgi:hypothetical protein